MSRCRRPSDAQLCQPCRTLSTTQTTTAMIEVFADNNCPFTHVGLKVIVGEIDSQNIPVNLRVRAWPLEWVNGSPIDVDGVAAKVAALEAELGLDDFSGFRRDRWPYTTLPALNLADAAYQRDAATGFAVSLLLRRLLFEEGQDISDQQVLADTADDFALPRPSTAATAGVHADYDEGKRRGVRASPDVWVEGCEFFCPSLDIGHDVEGNLTALFDDDGIREFVRSLS